MGSLKKAKEALAKAKATQKDPKHDPKDVAGLAADAVYAFIEAGRDDKVVEKDLDEAVEFLDKAFDDVETGDVALAKIARQHIDKAGAQEVDAANKKKTTTNEQKSELLARAASNKETAAAAQARTAAIQTGRAADAMSKAQSPFAKGAALNIYKQAGGSHHDAAEAFKTAAVAFIAAADAEGSSDRDKAEKKLELLLASKMFERAAAEYGKAFKDKTEVNDLTAPDDQKAEKEMKTQAKANKNLADGL